MSFKVMRPVTNRGYGTSVAAPVILNTPATINTAVPGETIIFTVPALTTMVILAVRLRCTAAAGVTTPAEAGVGIALGADDIFAQQPLYGFTVLGKTWVFPEGGAGVIANAGNEVKLGIDVIIGAGSQSIEADVIGYEV